MTVEAHSPERSDLAAESVNEKDRTAECFEISDEELKGVAGGPWVLPGDP